MKNREKETQEELHHLHASTSVISEIRPKSMRQAVHIAHMQEKWNSRYRLKDNIKAGFKEIVYHDMIQ
jgi:hypothetical protein